MPTTGMDVPSTQYSVLSLLLVRRPDHDVGPVEPGDGPADQQQVVVRVHRHDLQVADGDPLVAVPAGQLLAPLRPAAAAVTRQRRGRPDLAVDLLGAVGGRQPAEAPPLDDARRAPAL